MGIQGKGQQGRGRKEIITCEIGLNGQYIEFKLFYSNAPSF